MTIYTKVSRKNLNEDRVAICPQMGCKTIERVKPLKLGFLGFGKCPKCKQHNLPLVYVEERIGEVVSAALICLFDKSGLPPKNLLKIIEKRYPNELNTFINSWIYCITIGRGAKVISNYMDSLSKAYLKTITKKQLRDIRNQKSTVHQAINNGIKEITMQFERLLKHLRKHSEVFSNTKKIGSPSIRLRHLLTSWLEKSYSEEKSLLKNEEKKEISLLEIKEYYDNILNTGTCRCLLGLDPIQKSDKECLLSAFDRFSAYFEFCEENLTQKFTKADVDTLYRKSNTNMTIINNFTEEELKFIEKNHINISNLNTRWAWVNSKEIALKFYKEVILLKFEDSPKSHDIDEIGFRGFRAAISKLGIGVNDLTKAAGLEPHFEEKYTGMNYNDLLNLFKNKIYLEVKIKLNLKKGEAPRTRDLESKEIGYRGFVDNVRKASKKEGILRNAWGEFVKEAGLIPKKELYYQGMDFPELIDIYVKEIHPRLKMKYNLKDKQAPLKEQLISEYSGFRNAIRRLGYNLSDLYLILGFEHKFWKIYNNKSYRELIKFFKDIIRPSLQDIYDFSENEAPAYEEVEINYRGFIEALKRHGKKFSDVIKELGYIPRNFSNLGVLTHSIMNLLLSYYINKEEFPSTYYSEVELFSSSNHRIDGFQFITKSLISLINLNIQKYQFSRSKEEIENIKSVIRKIEGKQHLLIDFSNGFFKRGKTNSELVASKIKKYLDYPSSFLVLIGTNWNISKLIKRLPNSVKYKNQFLNTSDSALISPKLFGILFGMKGTYYELLNDIILNNKQENIKNLNRIYKKLMGINKINYYSTDDFNKVKGKNTLIKWL